MTVTSGAGDDTIRVGGGDDTLDPGAGHDEIIRRGGFDGALATPAPDGEDFYDLGTGIGKVDYSARGPSRSSSTASGQVRPESST